MNWKDDSKFPARLRQVREKAGLSQSEFAERVGVSRGAISTYELGDRVPDIRFMDKVIEEFGCSYDYLMGRAEAMRADSAGLSKETGLNDAVLQLVTDHACMLNTLAELAPDQLETACLISSLYIQGGPFRALLETEPHQRYDYLHSFARWEIFMRTAVDDLCDAARYAGYSNLTDEERRRVQEIIREEGENSTKAASWVSVLKRSLAAKYGADTLKAPQSSIVQSAMEDLKRYEEMRRNAIQSGTSPFIQDDNQ